MSKLNSQRNKRSSNLTNELSSPFTLKEIVEKEFTVSKWNGSWHSDNEYLYRDRKNSIILYNILTKKKKVLVPGNIMNDHKNYLDIVSWLFMKYMLSVMVKKKIDSKSQSSNKRSSNYFNKHFYSKKCVLGIPGVIYNGVADWVYEEEEVLSDTRALWFSSDNKRLAWVEFNDSLVDNMPIDLYGPPGSLNFQYPISSSIKLLSNDRISRLDGTRRSPNIFLFWKKRFESTHTDNNRPNELDFRVKDIYILLTILMPINLDSFNVLHVIYSTLKVEDYLFKKSPNQLLELMEGIRLKTKFPAMEVEDQLDVTEKLLNQYSFIDKHNIAIWGWSYGGFVSSSVLAQDAKINNIFKCGIAVAPQIFQNKKLLIVHGTADDNVHYQQSMMFSRALEEENILFQQISYPDESHGLGGIRPHFFHSLTHFILNECFQCNKTITYKTNL
ncbi:DPP4 [Lepeophtheirus salmonis]|uniref:DPP4 n=1 Tax=Lepeophtheirus salmonis TaxID=72036 RepID=A0A7R8CLW5_LEPSM|nr:DPP4 [Lepeophtheirus salmonis]CAF2816446.1 DPP4 [Lepeophtheirus salmonis]